MTEPYDAERLKGLIERLRNSAVTPLPLFEFHAIAQQAATALAAQAEQLAILRTEANDMRVKAISNARERNVAQREVAAQAEEIERLRGDAARYQWLRDHSVPPHNFYLSVPDEFADVKYSPGEVDAYIDEARTALGGKQDD